MKLNNMFLLFNGSIPEQKMYLSMKQKNLNGRDKKMEKERERERERVRTELGGRG